MIKSFIALFLVLSVLVSMGCPTVIATPTKKAQSTSTQLIAARKRKKARRTPSRSKSKPKHWSVGLKIPYKSWLPRRKPSKVLLCVHGLGFSSKSFARLGRYMAARGIAVYAVDVRGFGAWRRISDNHEVDFEACITDIENALRTIRSNLPGTRIYLVGESMGGAIALSVTSRYPDLVDAVISSVPSGDRYGNIKEKIIVGAHYLDDKDKPIDLSSEVIDKSTSNLALQDKLKSDPNIRMTLTPEELRQFNAFMRDNNDCAALIETPPVLMMAGFEDRLVKPKGTIELFNELTTPDKILVVIGDGEHLVLEESELTRETAGLIYNWILSH